MNRNKLLYVISGMLILAAGIGVTLNVTSARNSQTTETRAATADSLYVCSMHPWETATEPGSCTTCGMGLSHVEGFAPGDPIPSEDELFVDPNSPMKISVTRHEGWIPITESPFYQPRPEDEAAGHDQFMDDGAKIDHEGHGATEMEIRGDDLALGNELYAGAMHPWVQSHEPGTCDLCGMQLVKVEGWEKGDPMPAEADLYVDKNDPMKVSVTQKNGWIPITQSPFYEAREEAEGGTLDHSGHSEAEHAAAETSESGLWTCGMHPEVIQDEPGLCPICKMELTPLKKGSTGGGSAVSIDPVTLQNIGVVTVPAKRTDLHRTIRSNGTVAVAEENEVRVNARIGGWVEKLYVDRTGDPVRKGQTLLEIYSPELVSAQEEFVIALKNSDALRESGIEHVRNGGNDLLESAKRRLELWNIAPAEIERLERTREVRHTMPLVAPASGIVLHKNVVEGASVKPRMDLFTIADLDEIWVKAQIYEYELPWVREGDEVTVTSAYNPDLRLSGHIDYIYPTLDAKSRTAEVRIVLDNPNIQLKPDMYVDVRVHASPVENAVAVPKSAVIRSGERDIVFVKKDEGLFEPREVHLGMETDDAWEIAFNLDAGEPVVTSAQFLLDSEAKLQEAIQRRIEQRKAMGQSAENVDAGSTAGHNH